MICFLFPLPLGEGWGEGARARSEGDGKFGLRFTPTEDTPSRAGSPTFPTVRYSTGHSLATLPPT